MSEPPKKQDTRPRGVADGGVGEDDDIRGWRERPWLGAHSLGAKGKAVVVIRDVKPMLVKGKRGEQGKAVLYFQGLKKGMIMNASAEQRLLRLFPDPSMRLLRRRLIGQTIGLCIEIDKLLGGGRGPCLRIWPNHIEGTVSPELKATLEEMDKRMQSEADAQARGGIVPDEDAGRPAETGPEIPSVVDKFPGEK